MELTGLIITAAIMLVIVGWFIYRLVTDRESIRDKDPTVMQLLEKVHMMSSDERDRLDIAIDNGVFKDDDSIT